MTLILKINLSHRKTTYTVDVLEIHRIEECKLHIAVSVPLVKEKSLPTYMPIKELLQEVTTVQSKDTVP